ncbi:hypothetical protein LguiA_023006 [Lonicera macranthoides]
MPDEILLCDAWKLVTHDGKWCEWDNPQTWEKMAKIFNAAPKKENSLWKDRVVTPDQLYRLWAKVEPAVKKFNRFYNEKEMTTPYPRWQTADPARRGHYLAKFYGDIEREMVRTSFSKYILEKFN